MIRDKTIDNIELDIAVKNGVPLETVQNVMDFYYDSILKTIESDDFRVIKIDYFGKIVYNTKGKEIEK